MNAKGFDTFETKEKRESVNSTQRSLWIAFETQHNALYGSRCGVGTQFYRGFVVIPTDLY